MCRAAGLPPLPGRWPGVEGQTRPPFSTRLASRIASPPPPLHSPWPILLSVRLPTPTTGLSPDPVCVQAAPLLGLALPPTTSEHLTWVTLTHHSRLGQLGGPGPSGEAGAESRKS